MRFLLVYLFTITSILINGQSNETEQAMIDEINYVRQHPKEYAEYIMSYTEYWESSYGEIQEAKAVIKILKKMKPLPPLEFSEELYQDGQKHAQWMVKKDAFKHSKLPYGENLVGGEENVRYSVLSLLIDYGVPSRGHRKNILDPNYTKIACVLVSEPVDDFENVFIQLFD